MQHSGTNLHLQLRYDIKKIGRSFHKVLHEAITPNGGGGTCAPLSSSIRGRGNIRMMMMIIIIINNEEEEGEKEGKGR